MPWYAILAIVLGILLVLMFVFVVFLHRYQKFLLFHPRPFQTFNLTAEKNTWEYGVIVG